MKNQKADLGQMFEPEVLELGTKTHRPDVLRQWFEGQRKVSQKHADKYLKVLSYLTSQSFEEAHVQDRALIFKHFWHM